MKKEVIGSCPICNSNLKVTKLSCNNCGTELSGDFNLGKFNYLSKDELYFVEIFVKNQGSIKSIEKELGISYPTVKRTLNRIINKLGYEVNKNEEDKVSRSKILERLEKGEITPQEASELLKNN